MTPKRGLNRAFILIELLVVIAIIAVLVALLVPAIQKVRAAAANAQCVNNLKQIGTAVHAYHDTFKSFPLGPAAQWNGSTIVSWGWTFDILPFIDQGAIHKQGLNSATNDDFGTDIIPTYLCAADPRPNAGSIGHQSSSSMRPLGYVGGATKLARTSYLGVLGRLYSPPLAFSNDLDFGDGVFGGSGATINVNHITRGASATIMVGERPPSPDDDLFAFFWGAWASSIGVGDNTLWAIMDADAFFHAYTYSKGDGGNPCPEPAFFSSGDLIDYCHTNHFWSFHTGGGNWLFCDGSVRFMDYSAGTTVIPAMASINGTEVLPTID